MHLSLRRTRNSVDLNTPKPILSGVDAISTRAGNKELFFSAYSYKCLCLRGELSDSA